MRETRFNEPKVTQTRLKLNFVQRSRQDSIRNMINEPSILPYCTSELLLEKGNRRTSKNISEARSANSMTKCQLLNSCGLREPRRLGERWRYANWQGENTVNPVEWIKNSVKSTMHFINELGVNQQALSIATQCNPDDSSPMKNASTPNEVCDDVHLCEEQRAFRVQKETICGNMREKLGE